MVQNQTTNWKTEQQWIKKKKKNRITTDNTQKAKHVIRKDYPGAKSKTNATLITLNQSRIMKLIWLKGTGTPRLWVIALRLRDCNLHCCLFGSLRCFYLHYCQSIIRAFRSEANDSQECSFYSFAIYLVAVHIEVCGLFQDGFAAVEFCQSNSSSPWDKQKFRSPPVTIHLQKRYCIHLHIWSNKNKMISTNRCKWEYFIIIISFYSDKPTLWVTLGDGLQYITISMHLLLTCCSLSTNYKTTCLNVCQLYLTIYVHVQNAV